MQRQTMKACQEEMTPKRRTCELMFQNKIKQILNKKKITKIRKKIPKQRELKKN